MEHTLIVFVFGHSTKLSNIVEMRLKKITAEDAKERRGD